MNSCSILSVRIDLMTTELHPLLLNLPVEDENNLVLCNLTMAIIMDRRQMPSALSIIARSKQ